MITSENQINRNGKIEFELRGLSTDQKPATTFGGAKIANGSIFLEMDTQDLYFYDEATNAWLGGEGE